MDLALSPGRAVGRPAGAGHRSDISVERVQPLCCCCELNCTKKEIKREMMLDL
jgi:hypothetical protein